MIYTLTVLLEEGVTYEHDVSRTIEIEGSAYLDELHNIIQTSVDFDDDHLYAFVITKSIRSLKREVINDESGLYEMTVAELSTNYKGMHIYYWFDFGDDWMFRIKFSRKKPTAPVEGVSYPRIVQATGENPEQYPDYEW